MGEAAREQLRFVRPDFSGDLDPQPYLERVPPDALCKGMFFHDVMKAARRISPEAERDLLPQMGRRRYVAFKDYPLREHMELTARMVRRLYPSLPTREGMRRLGWLAYPTFAESMVGRVVFGVLGKDLDRIYEVGPRAFEVSLTRGRAVARRMGTAHWRYELEDIFGYLDTYYVGVMEGPIRHNGHVPDVRIHLTSPSDGVMDIRWR
ncbi:MAG: DUF2378 family protein [Myxococcota bacterium]